MRRLLAVLSVLLVAVVTACAQRLTVTEVRQAMEPMTVPMQRTDANGDLCALVKVSLPQPGVQFEGNTVGDALFKTNEYWVYMTHGTKMLNVKAPGYHSLMVDFRDHGINALESKSIYYVVLDAPGQAPAQPVVTANYVVLAVQPPTATVEIDGQQMPVEDGSVIALLKLGQHTWQAKAVGYASDSGTFEITAADKTSVNVQLRSQKARLTVSTVADAAVYVNGQQHGSGNQTLELLPGMYNIELRRQGYRPYTQTVELQASQSATVSCTEFTPVYGVLNVNYRPVGATITLNGRQVGTSPANLSNVNVGTYNLAISAPGYTTHTQQVTITEGTPVSLSGSLQKQTAAAPVTTTSSVSSGQYSTTPINLALCAELNGRTVYITQAQWEKMSATEQVACNKKGVCVIGDYADKTYLFLLALNDSGEKMTWNQAMSRYGDSLPTVEQGRVIKNNYKAINTSITAFGGVKNYTWHNWTRTEYNSSLAWGIYEISGVTYSNKTDALKVRVVSPVPDNNGAVFVNSQVGQYFTTPINLALCAELDGRTVYVTQTQWNAMSPIHQAAFKNKWLYVSGYDKSGNTQRFLLALKDNGKRIKWDKAMSHYGNSLPTKAQAEVMSQNREIIVKAITAFGGDKDPEWRYWTKTEYNSSQAWSVHMIDGELIGCEKNFSTRVRKVALVPSTEM